MNMLYDAVTDFFNSNFAFAKNRIIIFLFAFIIGLAFAFCISYWYVKNIYLKLENDKFSILEKESTALKKDKDDLQQRFNDLNSKYISLVNSNEKQIVLDEIHLKDSNDTALDVFTLEEP